MAYTLIDDPSAYFKNQIWTGDGNGSRAIAFDDTDTTMTPSLVWIKARSFSENHELYDSVRGVQKRIMPNDAGAEETRSQGLLAFSSDGFTIGTSDGVNKNTETYASWNWKAGTTSGLSGGDITPSAYSINTTSKIGIYAYTGNGGSSQTIIHGLGATPTCVIFKERGGAEQWRVQHMSAPNPFSKMLLLNAPDAEASQTNGLSAVSSTTITFGSDGAYNLNNDTYVCYIFCDCKGFSKMGKYIGDGSTSRFVHCGFRPAFVLGKNATQGSQHWFMVDNARSTFNGDSKWIKADSNSAELTNLPNPDFTANGFNVKSSNDIYNDSGETFVYWAFAEAPFVNSKGVPCNAK